MSRSFEDRHIGPASVDEAAMLKHLGYSDLTTFIKDVNDAVVELGRLGTLLTIMQSRETNKYKIEIRKKQLAKRLRN